MMRMRKRRGAGWAVLALVLAMMPVGGSEEPERKAILMEDFSDPSSGLAATLLRHKHVSLAPGAGPDGTNAIRVAYKGYDRGSERVVMHHALGVDVQEATLCFDVKFDKDFQWVKGGKLHGLGPDAPITGGKGMRPEGWSARIMWKEEGGLRSYLYHQDKPGEWGHSMMAEDFRFEQDRWYAVSLHVKVNSKPDIADGFMRVVIDGKPVLVHDQARFRGVTGKGTGIRRLLFSTFHGGNKPAWSPKHEDGSFATVHAWFDNFAVYAGEHLRKTAGKP